MTKSIVTPLKPDDVRRIDLSSAKAMPAPSPAAFEHFDQIHLHSALNDKSPRLSRREAEHQLRKMRLIKR
jgi:putative transposase